MKKGLLVIISSPSGGGKDAVIRALLQIFPNSTRFITTTSRLPRPDQKQGIDYYFISPEDFKKKIDNQKFIEYNFYAENYYGTEKEKLEEALNKYEIIFTQVEVNGKHNFDKANVPHLSIFLLPESLDILKQRIIKRGGLTPEIIAERLEIAQKEIASSTDYDYQIVNVQGKLDETIEKVADIIKKELNN